MVMDKFIYTLWPLENYLCLCVCCDYEETLIVKENSKSIKVLVIGTLVYSDQNVRKHLGPSK